MTAVDLGKPGQGPAGSQTALLTVNDLNIFFWVEGKWYPAVTDVGFELRSGEVLSIVGESGSGKSTTAMSILGLLPKNAHVEGSIKLGDQELVDQSNRALRKIRGKDIAVIFQEPMTALNPVYTIGFQISEMLRNHKSMGPKAARERAIELLRMVEIPEPERRVDSYPHQLSGGQRQRAMIAQSLALDPKLLIADEPTTALDVTVQAEILKLMRDLKHRVDASIILITHDMGVVADMADHIIVMKDGRIVETGNADAIFHHPQQPYTQELLGAVPHLGSVVGEQGVQVAEHLDESPSEAAPQVDPARRAGVPAGVEIIADLQDVAIEYPRRGRTPAFRAVEHLNLQIGRGEVVGLVGESGSGKTTIGRALVGLLPFVEGVANVLGTELAGPNTAPGKVKGEGLLRIRRDVSFVFQDPGSSLNPRLPVGESIGEPLLLQKVAKGKALSTRVEQLLDQVQLSRTMRNRYPHELSGGQRQRVGIARALALSPKLLIADEPTSALDVSVQAKVLSLFAELQREQGFACMFITHDLAVIEQLASRIAVLHHGALVELGTTAQILADPIDDYTKRLLAAVPVPDPVEQELRRNQRDRLLAAGVGVDEQDDSYEVFKE